MYLPQAQPRKANSTLDLGEILMKSIFVRQHSNLLKTALRMPSTELLH